jgi:hypothetical protein
MLLGRGGWSKGGGQGGRRGKGVRQEDCLAAARRRCIKRGGSGPWAMHKEAVLQHTWGWCLGVDTHNIKRQDLINATGALTNLTPNLAPTLSLIPSPCGPHSCQRCECHSQCVAPSLPCAHRLACLWLPRWLTGCGGCSQLTGNTLQQETRGTSHAPSLAPTASAAAAAAAVAPGRFRSARWFVAAVCGW